MKAAWNWKASSADGGGDKRPGVWGLAKGMGHGVGGEAGASGEGQRLRKCG